MKKTAIRVFALITVLVMIVTAFSSCSITELFSGNNEIPKTAILKTDLNDPSYTFTYGELKQALPLDKLADLFENYNEKLNDTEITLSYDDITSRFNADVMKDEGKALKNIWALCSPEEIASTTANKQQVIDYFNTLVNALKEEKPITEYSENFWTDDSKDSISFSRDGIEVDKKSDDYSALRGAAVIFKNYVLDGIDFINEKTEKGSSLNDILYLLGSDKVSLLTNDDIVSAVSSVKPELTTIDEIDYITGYTRTISITLKEEESSVLKAFSMHDKQPILDEMKKAENYMSVSDYSTSFRPCTITLYINAATDEITSIIYDKNMTVSSSFTGMNDFAELGKVDVKFDCTDRMNYQFGWHSSDDSVDTTKGFYKYNYQKDFKKSVASSGFYTKVSAADMDTVAAYFSGCDFDSSVVSDDDYIHVSQDKSLVYFYDADTNMMYYIHK